MLGFAVFSFFVVFRDDFLQGFDIDERLIGYDVEELGSETDLRLQQLSEGQVFTFAYLTDTDCSEVGIVAPYASDSTRNDVVGRAEVSMFARDLFLLLAVFDEEGNRLQATRLSRVPYDLDWLGTGRFDCDLELQARGVQIARASSLTIV